ncbi:hypothetical protein CLOP_g5520 [Closterium sp. NIES-67]|nr:hypothetical protein CLOP_g3090 [Closterium sp. NIES-67]GJP75024.1 hypothetical protein CLOP_g5520 [Closterium sp. NIES-67]
MAAPHGFPRLDYRQAAMPLLLLLLLVVPPRGSNAATRVVTAPLRGSDDRVEIFKMTEQLWFAGTAQLPPFDDSGNHGNDGSSGDNSSGDNSGSDNSGGDSGGDGSASNVSPEGGTTGLNFDNVAALIGGDPHDSLEMRKEETLARMRGGGGIAERLREAQAGGAGNGERSSPADAAAPSAAAPASAPAPAVDPLELQMEERLAEVGWFAARSTELKQVVKRKPAVGFPGISMYSEVNSGTPPKYNNTVVRVTPPDVALCMGNGYILHAVNEALVVYDTRGKQLTRIITHNEFFGALPVVVERREPYNTSVFGDNIGDMTCVYDRKARRFYLTTYWISGGFNNTFDKFGQTRRRSNTTAGAGLLVAASTADDPTQPWNFFFIPGSNDGINSNPDWRAPLHFNTSRLTTMLDYPQIGTDAHGFYVSVNQFPETFDKFFGSCIYAISKSQLDRPENATILRFVIPYTANLSNPSFTIYPQRVAADGKYDYSHGGTMYFGWSGNNFNSAPNETVLVANYTVMGAFAITGTSALGTSEAESTVEPHCAAVYTPPYFQPLPVTQKNGPIPLGWKLNKTVAPIGPSSVDARGVVVSPGTRQMWVSLMSAFGKEMSASAVVVRLRLSLRLKRKWRPFRVYLERFKVVGVGGGNSLIQPMIALNRHGKGIIATALAGVSFYPSAAYATVNANVDVGRVVVTGPGKAPLDDYNGYREGVNRYGDYMTATIDEEGNAWAAVQYVAGQPRSEWTNWATYIFKVDLGNSSSGGGDSGSSDGSKDGNNGGGNGGDGGDGGDGGNGGDGGDGGDGSGGGNAAV